MRKILLKFLICFIFLYLLSGCVREEYIDLSGFINSFDCEELSLNVDDFYYKENQNDETSYYTFINTGTRSVLLMLTGGEGNKLNEASVFIPKNIDSQSADLLSSQDILFFNRVSSSVISAFTDLNEKEADSIIREMYLYDKNSFINEGELTKKKDNFYFRYLSSFSGSQLTVINTYLKEPDETEKPESKPLYGDTTNIRQERTALE